MEGNIVSLTQHDYYGSHLQNYTYIAYVELLAFSCGDGWGGRKGEKLELKILGTNIENCFSMQMGNKKYR